MTATGASPRSAPGALLAAALLAGLLLAGCGGGSGETEATASPATATADTASTAAAPTGVPVQVDTVRREALSEIVTAPGRTESLRQDRVRAPFASRLLSLRVTDGDRVTAGEPLAEVVSKNSEAALQGAQQMLAAARTAQDSADAHRAIDVAQRDLVRQALHAPAAGVVLSHAAEEGDYLDENEIILTIAEAGAVYFDAQVTQGDLSRVHPAQRATIDMPAAGTRPLGAVVHGVLPAASSENLSAPVRLDLSPARPDLPVGLFGTARIVVARRPDATVVPSSAVLRDDVSGVSRVAIVGPGDIAHWVVVKTGTQQGARVEILSPTLPAGQLVITDGQVGLPDSSRVSIQP